MATYKYFVDGESDELYEFESIREYDCNVQIELDLLAELIAEDYYDEYDGWEDNWPIRITIIKDGQEIATFSVNKEYEPVFSASRIDDN
ncbi:MAG: hypothetical protein [Bacteriophage sp.]|nr:MAG: hypothetical protein [Bacteriophage sp.]